MDHKTFSERLTESMASQGLKQVDLLRTAKEAGVKLGKSQLSQYISGKTLPRKNIAIFLADTLKVEPDWL